MADHINHLNKELAELVVRHTDRDGPQSSEIPALSFSRHSSPHRFTGTGAPYRIDKPSIYVVVQGVKDVIFGEERFRYGPPNYLVASMDLPIIAEVLEASEEVPNLSCRIEFTHTQILELLSDTELKMNFKGKSKRGMNVAELDVSLLDAIVRLVRLLDKPCRTTTICLLVRKKMKCILFVPTRVSRPSSTARFSADVWLVRGVRPHLALNLKPVQISILRQQQQLTRGLLRPLGRLQRNVE